MFIKHLPTHPSPLHPCQPTHSPTLSIHLLTIYPPIHLPIHPPVIPISIYQCLHPPICHQLIHLRICSPMIHPYFIFSFLGHAFVTFQSPSLGMSYWNLELSFLFLSFFPFFRVSCTEAGFRGVVRQIQAFNSWFSCFASRVLGLEVFFSPHLAESRSVCTLYRAFAPFKACRGGVGRVWFYRFCICSVARTLVWWWLLSYCCSLGPPSTWPFFISLVPACIVSGHFLLLNAFPHILSDWWPSSFILRNPQLKCQSCDAVYAASFPIPLPAELIVPISVLQQQFAHLSNIALSTLNFN